MSSPDKQFQPGVILHEVIVGCMRAKGMTLGAWCEVNDIPRSTVTTVTHGQMSGPRGQLILDRLLKAAGPDMVAAAYRQRILREAKRVAADAEDAA